MILSIISRKFKTARNLYEDGGLKYLLRNLKQNIKRFPKNSRFNEINRLVIEEIDKYHLNISKEMARSVSYPYLMDVKGDIAEFGTMTGHSAVAITTASNLMEFQYRNNKRSSKNLHFFDSFEGLPEANNDVDKSSPHVLEGIWAKGTCKGLSKVEFENLINKYLGKNKFFVYKGWFKDTVLKIPDDVCFSFIHIDGDLYQSAIDVLDFLFKMKKISQGAMILFDDWNCNAANPNLGEKRAFSEMVDKYKIDYSDEGGYSVGSHKFIINSYE